jgi:hypothetical protein
MLRTFSVQAFLLRTYASESDGGWNASKVVEYLWISPFKRTHVSLELSQGKPKQDIEMVDALLLYVSTDVGMKNNERSLISEWVVRYNRRRLREP